MQDNKSNIGTPSKIAKLNKPYDPAEIEPAIYKIWEDSGYFNPDNLPQIINKEGQLIDREEPYTIILPPPNVTGTLHTGHAIMLAIQDTLIRYHRMQGKRTLWLPGTDHAAIATQSVVEKKIQKEEGKSRHDIGREEMLKRVNQFALASQNTIITQFKSMGATLDWSRLAFTLDKERNNAVNTMFKKMYEDGLIYKGHRIVNWDPKGQTTISDDELVYIEEKSKFYYFKYGPFTIGTARPETKFGDKYVVMNPNDSRYKDYKHGDKISVDWVNETIEATIIKDGSVDPEFGTGVMTITPWHSVVDFDLAQKYKLDYKQIIDKYGKILPVAGSEFAGLKIKEAREKIVERLASKGLLVNKDGNQISIYQIEDYTHNIATAERTGGIVEPQIMNQWFVNVNKEFNHFDKVTTLKQLMHKAVASDKINIMPDRFEKIYHHWIDNLRDWCISRQIWYGHRVPVWYKGDEMYVGIEAPNDDVWTQDEDTLDTWFSSGMWTFSTLGWPNKTKDLETYHPTSLLETGHDILFFWVARMILFSTYALNEIPFKKVYLHGLVRDKDGKKMSKSLGNVLDPRDLSAKYGTDALRMALIVANGPGNDLKLNEDKVKAYKLFANKIWNAARFVLTRTSNDDPNAFDIDEVKLKQIINSISNITIIKEKNIAKENKKETSLNEEDQALLNQWLVIKQDISKDIEEYRLHIASEKLYNYFWKTFCDVIIETHKMRIVNAYQNKSVKNKELEKELQDDAYSAKALLLIILKENIKALHPFMPFITEELWAFVQSDADAELLVVERW